MRRVLALLSAAALLLVMVPTASAATAAPIGSDTASAKDSGSELTLSAPASTNARSSS